jgi:hypothetical protein
MASARVGQDASAERQLEEKLAALPGMSREDLTEQFQAAYGKNPPRRLSTRMLALAVAYRLQEKVHGGLKPAVRRALLSGTSVAIPRAASAGSVLIREWRGRQHTVTVHTDRVEYAGETFRSLTEVALRITGQKRSGPAFFGLRSPRV